MHHDQQWLITPSVEEKPPRCLPAYMYKCVYVSIIPDKRVNVAPRTHVYTRVYISPKAISHRRPTDNSYLGEAVFLPTSSEGGMPSSGPCLFLWEFRLSLSFIYTYRFARCKNYKSYLCSGRVIIREKNSRQNSIYNFMYDISKTHLKRNM